MDDQKIEKAHLLGHSMGGKTVMRFAIQNPDKTDKLIVADIAPKSYPALRQNILTGLKSIPISKIKSRNEADKYLKEYVPVRKTRQFLLKNLHRKADNSYTWHINLDAIYDHASDIGNGISTNKVCKKPTLFIRGEKSEYLLEKDRALIMKLFPHAKIIEIKEASHWVHAEKPDEFLEVVKSFL